MTPMMKQWQEVKAAHSDCIVFFRLGDFYEMFFDDAKTACQVLGITLTGRDCGMETRAPMCGVPHHSANTYIKKLVENGYRVAVCEQVSAVTKGQMVDRDVIKIITAGTYSDENFLEATQNNFVAAIYTMGEHASVAWCDITTGEFFAINTKTTNLDDIKSMINPREIIDSNGHYGYAFNSATAYGNMLRYFNITSTKIFDLEKDDKIINSAGALLHYLILTQKKTVANITKIAVVRQKDFMIIDKTARENLELTHAYRFPNQKKGSLLWVLDDTKTAMGARELVHWINQPLQNIDAINERFDAIQALQSNPASLRDLRGALENVADISRLCGKAASGVITPRDMQSLRYALDNKRLKSTINTATTLLKQCHDGIVLLPDLVNTIERAIIDQPPMKTDEGGFIRAGFDKKLDEIRSAETQGREWLSKLEQTERLETQIKELKIAYNRIIGYYFEIPTKHAASVPYRFTRKGSTANCDRFMTDELKELEGKILNARENAITLELNILTELRKLIIENLDAIIGTAKSIAALDVLQSLATVAQANGYVRPTLNNKCQITLKNARHAVVEKLLGINNFIANDCDTKNFTMLITGPNMAGKSTYMRTVATGVLMAHIGSFVPADEANICLTDRIFTRIGASDSLLTGESTFMVEMNEVSNIVNNATKQSLILIDEVGRGTGTSDGFALASAIVTYITDKIGANTLFATHFHELTNLSANNPRIKNFKVLTEQLGNEIVFLHKLQAGIETNSFGIDVAKLAGLPKEIVDNARKLLV